MRHPHGQMMKCDECTDWFWISCFSRVSHGWSGGPTRSSVRWMHTCINVSTTDVTPNWHRCNRWDRRRTRRRYQNKCIHQTATGGSLSFLLIPFVHVLHAAIYPPPLQKICTLLAEYLRRLSGIIDNKLNCGPVLSWMEVRRAWISRDIKWSINA